MLALTSTVLYDTDILPSIMFCIFDDVMDGTNKTREITVSLVDDGLRVNVFTFASMRG